jgi:N-acetylglucosaminyl-diphospho-decaprenol L-rhamnosyltransferase
MTTKLSIVIVNYNGGQLVMECLESLFKHAPQHKFEVIVVDNKSVDGSAEKIEASFPQVNLLHMEVNLGLTKAFNQGVAHSNGEYVLSLDNDTIVLPDTLNAMIEFADSTPKAGACGAKLINPDGSPQHTARRFPRVSNAFFGRGSWLTKWFPRNSVSLGYLMSNQESSEQPYEVDTLSAACLMVRRKAIDEVGALDEAFFVYWCDTDWCFRIKEGDWSIYSLPTHEIIHNENSRTRHRKGRRIRGVIDFHRGVYRFYRKHYVRSPWNPMNLIAIVGLSTRAGLLIAADEVNRWMPKMQPKDPSESRAIKHE